MNLRTQLDWQMNFCYFATSSKEELTHIQILQVIAWFYSLGNKLLNWIYLSSVVRQCTIITIKMLTLTEWVSDTMLSHNFLWRKVKYHIKTPCSIYLLILHIACSQPRDTGAYITDIHWPTNVIMVFANTINNHRADSTMKIHVIPNESHSIEQITHWQPMWFH